MNRVSLPVLDDRSARQSAAPPATFAAPLDPLRDRFERSIRYLRVSVTDRCNFACTYCVPDEGVEHKRRADLCTFEELERIVGVFAGLGVRRLRLTGGEPTVRHGFVELVARMKRVPGIEEVVMTTNGHLLSDLAGPLAAAGLHGANVSIDTLDGARFAELTSGGDLARVIAGIDAAIAAGLEIKLNAVALAGVNDGEIAALCAFAWERGLTMRFIEHMPLSSGALYQAKRELSAQAIRDAAAHAFGALEPSPVDRGIAGPARYWRLARPARPSDGRTGLIETGAPRELGIISAMTEHFCAACNRVRLTADGQLHACLGHDDAVNLRDVVREGGSDDDLRRAIAWSVQGKREGHEFQRSGDGGPMKHMIAMGG